jgi:hypothetical protein
LVRKADFYTTASAAITPPTITDSRSGRFGLSGAFDPAFRAAPSAAQKWSAIKIS